MSNSSFTSERRDPKRQDLDGEVVVELQTTRLVGSGQNISQEGVFFISDGSVPVKVRIEGEDGEIRGEIVRIESMGGGRTGVAVRFDDV